MYTCIALRGVFTSVLEESQGLITYAFVILLLAMISLHMLTFRLMVTMVAEFCSLVILIHNTLLGEITISSTRTTRVKYHTSIPQFIMIHFHRQRFNLIDFMVIELRFFKKNKKMENMAKCEKHFLRLLHTFYITTHPIFACGYKTTRAQTSGCGLKCQQVLHISVVALHQVSRRCKGRRAVSGQLAIPR